MLHLHDSLMAYLPAQTKGLPPSVVLLLLPLVTIVFAILAGRVVFALALPARKRVPVLEVPLSPALTQDDGVKTRASKTQDLLDPKRPGYLQCYDPATSQRLGEVPIMTAKDVNSLVGKAKKAQAAWAKTSFDERRRVLTAMQHYIVAHMEEIARACSRDSGKPKIEALLGEIMTTCEKIRTVNAQGEAWLKPQYRTPGPMMMHKTAYVEFQPLGVLGVIAPWNYPFHNLYNHVISGLFAGNAVVSKVSEYTSWSSSGYFSDIIRSALVQCGHSPDLVAVVTGLGEAGAALVACPDVDKIIFTGSPGIGKKVMEGAAPHLKPVILELGGKDPMVVMEDADIEGLVPMAMKGAFFNCGQNCCGVERFYVYESVHDRFVAEVVKRVAALRQGPPLSGAERVDCGALVMPRQVEIIQGLVDQAADEGAKVVVGGKPHPGYPQGNFFQPTVLVNVTNEMAIAQEEVFGPVMTIIKVPDDDDATCLRMVNACKYGLGSSVFSKDAARALRLGQQIRAGMTTINDFGVNYLVQALPFGGTKHSGFDRFAGPEGLQACCLMKSVVTDTIPFVKTSIPAQLQYPVSEKTFGFGQGLLGLFYEPTWSGKLKAVRKLM